MTRASTTLVYCLWPQVNTRASLQAAVVAEEARVTSFPESVAGVHVHVERSHCFTAAAMRNTLHVFCVL